MLFYGGAMVKESPRFVTRFAPSPTGRLHKGHAYSALITYRRAVAEGGRFLLRIEDIDTTRCKPEFVEAIYEDLAWLGLISAPHGPDGPIYPGLCRHLSADERQARIASGEAHAWRLDLGAALNVIGAPLRWHDDLKGTILATPEELGDVVLARKDTPTSYHLSVVVDDGLQGITHITRGEDLFHATHIHVVLQRLLGLPTPTYHHHGLLLDEHGQRFAKRNLSVTLASLRESGADPVALGRSLLSQDQSTLDANP
jgi:glutamyl-Q tRNA(Asp) synthetase